jgi:hypothetical protein
MRSKLLIFNSTQSFIPLALPLRLLATWGHRDVEK